MSIIIVKYNAGNIQSVLIALERLGIAAVVTDDVEQIKTASKVIFPGVGEASTAMNYLRERRLDEVIRDLKQPVLGICLGMQLLCSYSEENSTQCMGVIPVKIKRFPASHDYKVPQVGWNSIYDLHSDLFKSIPEQSFVYNVHSYFAEDSDYTIANCEYGIT
ncbi:MAG TPA: imidazole glycerol phosphate synthase subunit HisH, partial [Chitinophagaceae bacterium]